MPSVTTDALLFTREKDEILLIKRLNDPGKDMWALPGGYIELDEELEESVARELLEETGIDYREDWMQVGAYGAVNRDPRGRVIMVAFMAIVDKNDFVLKAGDDAKEVRWFLLNDLPELAFDHKLVIDEAHSMLFA